MELYDNIVAFRSKPYNGDKSNKIFHTHWEDGFVRLDFEGNVVNPADKVIYSITSTIISKGVVRLPKRIFKGFVNSLIIDSERYWKRQLLCHNKIINLDKEPDDITKRYSVIGTWTNNYYRGANDVSTNIILYNSIYLIK